MNWKPLLLLMTQAFFLAFAARAQYPAGSPVDINGKLSISGGQLVNECNNAVQLRGMSTHGPQWFDNCYNESSLNALVNDWGIDVFRIAMYVEEDGYVDNPSHWKSWIDNMVNECAERGIYCLIDWHILEPGDPWARIDAARDFWTYMSTKHSGKAHVLYEIANEPNGVQWSRIKSYAEDIIPRIRANDPNTVIIVGTSNWSQDVDIAAQNPLNFSNIMYTLHFYSGTHTGWLRNKAEQALNAGLALFVTEFGTSEASGDGGPYLGETQNWMDWMAANSISWVNWSFADKAEVSAALSPGACDGGNWNSTSQSGTFIKDHILNPADNFVCSNGTTTYTITASAGTGGSISPAGNISVNEGASQSFSITPDAGYQISSVHVDQVSAGAVATYSFDHVTSNHAISASFSPVNTEQQAYPNGVPHAIPGNIEAVNFDIGGEGVAYHDSSAGNEGPGPRQDQNVDTENQVETGNIGWITDGEWLEYTVNVAEAGVYDIAVQVASNSGGGAYHIEFDGADVTGVQSVSQTGGWGSFITHTLKNISLTAGQQVMRIFMDTGDFNLGSIQLTKSGSDDEGNCDFDTPRSSALPGLNKSYSYAHVLGMGGPDLSNIATFTINWDLINNGLWQLSINTSNGNPNWYVDLTGKNTNSFSQASPAITITGSGFSGLDGSYYVNLKGDDFVMVSQHSGFTIYFSNSPTPPPCQAANAKHADTTASLNGNIQEIVFPNPFTDEVNISLASPELVEEILIYNPLGVLIKKIKKGNIKNQNSISIEKSLLSGLYVIKINTPTEVKVLRAIKQ